MPALVTRCPICWLDDSSVTSEATSGRRDKVTCPRCGVFEISDTAVALELQRRGQLSAWLRQINLHGGRPPVLTSDVIGRKIQTLPNYTALEKQRLLLFAIDELSEHPGAWVPIDRTHSISLAWSDSPLEFIYCLSSLEERGFITSDRPSKTLENLLNHSQTTHIRITSDGWEYIDQYRNDKQNQDQAFIAMSFNAALDPVFDNGIHPGISNAGFRPYRIDRENHNKRIDAKIIAEIKKSRFLVADVTEHKQGVYYEAGFAQGQGMEVIWTVRENDLDNAHFDTKQFRHITWGTPEKLSQDLTDMIQAVIGLGPLPVEKE